MTTNTTDPAPIPERPACSRDLSVEGLDDGTLTLMAEHEPDAVAELPYGGAAYEPRQHANAHLFAASPKLFDALRDLVIENDRYGGVPTSSPAWSIARSALADAANAKR